MAGRIRVSEALELELRDTRLDNGRPTLRIREGKDRKSREVPVHPELQAALIAATSYGAVGVAPWSTFHGRRPCVGALVGARPCAHHHKQNWQTLT